MALPQYQYSRINLAADSIRRIRILRDDFDSSVRCGIFESYLDREIGVPYEALSYTWGDLSIAKVPVEIVNENTRTSSYLCIYPILYDILRHLRHDKEDRILWVDAACIDQEKSQERTHQVAQMRQVYERADRVVVWLGFVEIDMTGLMDFAQQLDCQASTTSTRKSGTSTWATCFRAMICPSELQGLQLQRYEQMRSAMSHLLQMSWFRRTWIIQEVASAKSGLVLCGQEGHLGAISVPMRTFALLPPLMQLKPTPHTQAVLDVMPTAAQRRNGWWNKRHDLMTLLAKFSECECSDSRDSVYALLGICSDVEVTKTLRPDYRLCPDTVFRNTLSYLLFSEIVESDIYKLPEMAVWHGDLGYPYGLEKRILIWALSNGSDKVTLHLLGLRDVPWDRDFRLSRLLEQERFQALTRLVWDHPEMDPKEHFGPRLGVRVLLQLAVDKNDHEAASLLLMHKGLNINCKSFAGNSLLGLAVYRERLEIVQSILKYEGINVCGIDVDYESPLYVAATLRNSAIMKELLLYNDNDTSYEHIRPAALSRILKLATKEGWTDIVDLLLQNESMKVELSKDDTIEIALCCAARRERIETLERIWNYPGIILNSNVKAYYSQENDGLTTLLGTAAAQEKGLYMVKLIMGGSYGEVDVNKTSTILLSDGSNAQWTPLKVAVMSGREDIVQHLRESHENVLLETGAGDWNIRTALWIATSRTMSALKAISGAWCCS